MKECANPLCHLPVTGQAKYCCQKCKTKAWDMNAEPRVCTQCGAEFRSKRKTCLCDACFYKTRSPDRKPYRKKKVEPKHKTTFEEFIEAQREAKKNGKRLSYGVWMAQKEGKL